MKIKVYAAVFCVILLGTTTLGHAEEPAYYETNSLETLHYRLPQGHGDGTIGVTTRLFDTETVRQDAGLISQAQNNTLRSTSWATNVAFNYGLRDDFEFGIGESYLFGLGTESTSNTDGSTGSWSSSGFSSPTLHLNYRYWGALAGGHFASVYLDLTPAIGNRLDADSGQHGNNLNRASAANLGTNLYWVAGSHEWSFEPALHYNLAGSSRASTYNDSSDSYWTYNLSSIYRFHFYPAFYFQLNADVIGDYTISYTNNFASGVEHYTSKVPLHLLPSISFGWKLAANWLASAAVTYNGIKSTTSFVNNVTIFGVSEVPDRNYSDEQYILNANVKATF